MEVLFEVFRYLVILFIVIGVIACIPALIYVTIKAGTYAFFTGRQLFHDEQRKKEVSDGKKQS